MAAAPNMPFTENNDRLDLPGLMGEVALRCSNTVVVMSGATDVVSPKARRRT